VLEPAGSIQSVMDDVVVVQGLANSRALVEGCVAGVCLGASVPPHTMAGGGGGGGAGLGQQQGAGGGVVGRCVGCCGVCVWPASCLLQKAGELLPATVCPLQTNTC